MRLINERRYQALCPGRRGVGGVIFFPSFLLSSEAVYRSMIDDTWRIHARRYAIMKKNSDTPLFIIN